MVDSSSERRLPWNIRRWVAKLLAEGYSENAVCRSLSKAGYEEHSGRSEIAELAANPAFGAAVDLARSRDKLVLLMDALAQQLRQSAAAHAVPVMCRPDPVEFFDRYYYGNRPVIVRGLMDEWSALGKWTPEWLKESFGNVAVEVTSRRDTDPHFEEHFDRHRTKMSLGDFITATSSNSGNDLYLVSKNRILDQPEFVDLLDDFISPQGFLRSDERNAPGLWLGPAGTKTPLHHDSTNIFFAQVFGSKRIRLIPPFEIGNVYNDRSCYSAVDIDSPDLAKFPRFTDVSILDATVSPGDFLLLPVGWWHTVESLSTSLSLSFHNFAVEGDPVVWRWRESETKRRSLY